MVLWEKQISNAGDSSRRISKMPCKVDKIPTEVKIPWRLGKCAMEKPSTNRLTGRTVSLSKGRNGRISQFRKQGPPQEGIAINQVRKLGCSNEGHKVKPSPVKSHHCQTVRTHSLIGTTGHDFCRRRPKVPGRGGKTCGGCSGKRKETSARGCENIFFENLGVLGTAKVQKKIFFLENLVTGRIILKK